MKHNFCSKMRYSKLSSISMLKIVQATIRKSFLVSQSFLIDVNLFKWEAPVAGIRLSLSKTTITGPSFSAGSLRDRLPGSAPISLQWIKLVLIIHQCL